MVLGFIVLGILVSVALVGWGEFAGKLLKFSGPEIELVEVPRGIGAAPVTLRAQIRDHWSGLRGVVVRARNLHHSEFRTLVEQDLQGELEAPLAVTFPGDQSGLEEGEVEIEIIASDLAIWENRSSKAIRLRVDYRRPKVIPLTTQATIREGGTHLLFYRVFDEDLALSGVKVGNNTFAGFPARGMDPELSEPNLFVVLFTVPLGGSDQTFSLRLFGEDGVGNAATADIAGRLIKRVDRQATVVASEEYLRRHISGLATEYFTKLNEELRKQNRAISFSSPDGSTERLFEEYQFVERDLREANEVEIASYLRGPRFERFWDDAFEPVPGALRFGFGDTITAAFEKRELGKRRSMGLEIDLKLPTPEVNAVNEGIVVISRRIGVYGRVVGIDHGLGLVSLYGNLDQVTVKQGERVNRGQAIGVGEKSWFGPGYRVLVQFRLHSIPVDPAEWFDRVWYGTQIQNKVNDVRRSLKLPVYEPIR
jgi:murein DD-endopeptidase MepM/ murein hydrolase activator NlpD